MCYNVLNAYTFGCHANLRLLKKVVPHLGCLALSMLQAQVTLNLSNNK